jgi:hypothetical protein
VNNVERQLDLISPQSELIKIFYLFQLFAFCNKCDVGLPYVLRSTVVSGTC